MVTPLHNCVANMHVGSVLRNYCSTLLIRQPNCILRYSSDTSGYPFLCSFDTESTSHHLVLGEATKIVIIFLILAHYMFIVIALYNNYMRTKL